MMVMLMMKSVGFYRVAPSSSSYRARQTRYRRCSVFTSARRTTSTTLYSTSARTHDTRPAPSGSAT